MFLNYWLFQWKTAAITSHVRQVPATGRAGAWDPDQRHSSSCHWTFLSCSSAVPSPYNKHPALRFQISLLFSKEKSSMVVTFTKSVFLVLLLQAVVAETFIPLSPPPSPPLPQGNSMGSPFLWPHTATKLSSPGGQGACAITGSPHLRAQGKHRVPSCICIWIACFLNNVLRGTAFKLG